MNKEDTKSEKTYTMNEDHVATVKDLRIIGLELRMEIDSKINGISSKINGITIKLGTLIIGCSSILFGLLSYFHK